MFVQKIVLINSLVRFSVRTSASLVPKSMKTRLMPVKTVAVATNPKSLGPNNLAITIVIANDMIATHTLLRADQRTPFNRLFRNLLFLMLTPIFSIQRTGISHRYFLVQK